VQALRGTKAARLRPVQEQPYAKKEQLFFAIEEKSHEADLTEKGRKFMSRNDPDAFMLPDLPTLVQPDRYRRRNSPARRRSRRRASSRQHFEERAQVIHAIAQLLKAYCLYDRDVQYVVQDNKVIIVDEHTGRMMPGRRWSRRPPPGRRGQGEACRIERETQTLATITIQNYFRMYQKLAGMTGTAETEAAGVPRHLQARRCVPSRRTGPASGIDDNDIVYKTRSEKFQRGGPGDRRSRTSQRPARAGRHHLRRDRRRRSAAC
jgi:preprotein translocase subunit SecA